MNDVLTTLLALSVIALLAVGYLLLVHRIMSPPLERLRRPEHQDGIDDENAVRAELAEEASSHDEAYVKELADRWRDEDERRWGRDG